MTLCARGAWLAAVVVAATLAPASTAGGGLRIVETGGARFPDRAFVLTLPDERRLASEDVRATENRKAVSGVSLVPADAAGENEFGVVLVVDASNSMRGVAIERAIEAARSFAARRFENQEIGVVAFNGRTAVTLPLTTDATAIDAALADTPPLAEGSRLYDAVVAAVSLLEGPKVTSGSVVVLSDGADTGSRASATEAASAARDARVRIFSIGLKSPAFDASALEALANAAGGDFLVAGSSTELDRIYAALGARLSNEYLLRYRSLAGPDETVELRVEVAGIDGIAVATYTTPSLPSSAAAPLRRSLADQLWRSPVAMAVVSVVSGVLLTLAFVLLVVRRTPRLRDRMALFVSLPVKRTKEAHQSLTEKLLAGTDKSLDRTRWWSRFKEDVEVAKIALSAVKIVVFTVAATVLTVLMIYALAGPLFASTGLAIPLVARGVVKRKLERERRAFAEQLPDNLQVLGSALRAGHSFVGALSVVVDDAAEPSRSEFRRVVGDEQLGVPLEEALDVVARRMASRDLEQVSLVAALQRQTGANSAEVLDRVSETVRERSELRRMVKALTAQGRMARWIVSLLPVALLVVLTVLNADYTKPLFTHPVGRILLFFAAVMVVSGSLVIKRVVNVKV